MNGFRSSSTDARHLACGLLTGLALLLAGLPARAGVELHVGSTTASAGSTGNALDVLLLNTGPAPLLIAAFAFELGSSSGDIVFTGAGIDAPGLSYVFAGDSGFGPVISTSVGATLVASDLFDIPGAGASVAAGASVLLGHVLFDVAPSAASGSVDITLASFPATSLAGADGGAIDIPAGGQQGGVIGVTGAVPEPGRAALSAAGLALLLRLARRRRIASAAAPLPLLPCPPSPSRASTSSTATPNSRNCCRTTPPRRRLWCN